MYSNEVFKAKFTFSIFLGKNNVIYFYLVFKVRQIVIFRKNEHRLRPLFESYSMADDENE